MWIPKKIWPGAIGEGGSYLTAYAYWDFLESNIDKFNKGDDVLRRNLVSLILPMLLKEKVHYASRILEKIGTLEDLYLFEPFFRDKWVLYTTAGALLPYMVAKIATAEHITLIKPLLMEKDKYVLRAAFKALEKIGIVDHITIQRYLQRDLDNLVCIDNLVALGKIGTTEQTLILESLLSDNDYRIRSGTAQMLEEIATPEHIPLLEQLLRDKNDSVRYYAVKTLGKVGNAEHVPLLESLLMDKFDWVRCEIAEVVFEIGTAEHIPLLEPLLRDKNERVRSYAARALRRIGNTEHLPLLEPLLSDKDAQVRKDATYALGKFGNAEHIPLLEPLLRDWHPEVRSSAISALGMIGTVENLPLPLLESLLEDNDPYVRSGTANVFRKIETEEHVPLLESLLKDEHYFVRKEAAQALANFGSAEHVPLLEPLLKDEHYFVRKEAAQALANIGSAEHVSLLEPLLKDENHLVRKEAAQALANTGSAEHVPFLKLLLSDADSGVRCVAAQALANIGNVEHFPLLELLLRDDSASVFSEAVRALGNIVTYEDIPLLKPLLKDWDSEVRMEAAKLLGNIASVKDISLLSPLLCDWNEGVRSNTTIAIERILKRSPPELHIEDGLPKRKEKQALFTKTVPTRFLHILHISDIHYSVKNDPFITRIFHEFLQDIQQWRRQQNNQNIHAICLTGDIAQSGKKDQYFAINQKINKILETTGCSKDNLFIIPGNHDVHEYDDISDKGKTTLEQVWKNKKNIDSHVLSNYKKYREFHEKFSHYYGFVETSGYLNSLTEKRSGIPRPWYSRKLKDFPVRIIGLNSALFCLKDYSQRGKIRMGTHQFHEAYFQGQPGDTENGEMAILLTHHPMDWLEETEKDDLKTLIDRYSVIHLHGHVHRLSIDEVRSYSGSTYILIGTGSIYGEKGTKDINTYHIMTLDFQEEEIHIWGRRWVPEFGMWTVFADNSRNTFPFPPLAGGTYMRKD